MQVNTTKTKSKNIQHNFLRPRVIRRNNPNLLNHQPPHYHVSRLALIKMNRHDPLNHQQDEGFDLLSPNKPMPYDLPSSAPTDGNDDVLRSTPPYISSCFKNLNAADGNPPKFNNQLFTKTIPTQTPTVTLSRDLLDEFGN